MKIRNTRRAWLLRGVVIAFVVLVLACVHVRTDAVRSAAGWPAGIVAIAQMRGPGDKGVGDTVHALLAGLGADRVTRLLGAAGVNCGCASRQKWLNEHYPY